MPCPAAAARHGPRQHPGMWQALPGSAARVPSAQKPRKPKLKRPPRRRARCCWGALIPQRIVQTAQHAQQPSHLEDLLKVGVERLRLDARHPQLVDVEHGHVAVVEDEGVAQVVVGRAVEALLACGRGGQRWAARLGTGRGEGGSSARSSFRALSSHPNH